MVCLGHYQDGPETDSGNTCFSYVDIPEQVHMRSPFEEFAEVAAWIETLNTSCKASEAVER